jgi:plastocyanin
MSLSFSNRYFTLALPLLIVVTLAILAGCGSTSAGSGDTGAPTATSVYGDGGATATAAPTDTTASGSTGSVVNVTNFSFSPSTLTVKAGTTVTFKGITGAHTVTSDTGSPMAFDQGVSEGSSITITFVNPGTYKYHCSIHSTMHGTIVVTA